MHDAWVVPEANPVLIHVPTPFIPQGQWCREANLAPSLPSTQPHPCPSPHRHIQS